MSDGTRDTTMTEGSERRRSRLRVPVVAVLATLVALGVLAVVEPGPGSTSMSGEPVAHWGGVGAFFDRAAGHTGARGAPAPDPAVAAAEALARDVKSPDQAVTTADNAANVAGSAAQAAGAAVPAAAPNRSAALRSGTANRGEFGFVCGILLNARSRVDAQLQVLIARFPSLADRLAPVRARVDAQINAQLARFGCTVSGAA